MLLKAAVFVSANCVNCLYCSAVIANVVSYKFTNGAVLHFIWDECLDGLWYMNRYTCFDELHQMLNIT